MKVENEHLAEIPHLGVLRVRSKGGEVFGLDAVAIDRQGIHLPRTEAPFVGIVSSIPRLQLTHDEGVFPFQLREPNAQPALLFLSWYS